MDYKASGERRVNVRILLLLFLHFEHWGHISYKFSVSIKYNVISPVLLLYHKIWWSVKFLEYVYSRKIEIRLSSVIKICIYIVYMLQNMRW